MISRTQAVEAARAHLAELEQEVGEPLVLVEDAPEERNDGWLFHFNSARYVETEDVSHALAGNWPFLVRRNDGQIETLRDAPR